MPRCKPPPTLDAATRAFCEEKTVELLPFIVRLAQRSNLPLPVEDLVNEGAMAVFAALPRYDASRGAKLQTWLRPRIIGAFRDYARKVGRFLKGGERGRGDTIESLHAKRYQTDSGREVRLADCVATPPPPAAGDWGRLLRGFSKRDRLVVLAYFVLGHTMQRIAADLNLSESRVSQLMTELLQRLRRREAADGSVTEALVA